MTRMAEHIERLELENAERATRIAELKSENAKLREQLGSIVSRSFRTADKMACLEAENAELRELVRDMWNGMCGYAHECRSCEHYELYEGQRFVGECEYYRRIRELGIEVE